MELVIGVSGASGVIYAVRLLEALKEMKDVRTHVIFSDYARINLEIETAYSLDQVRQLADFWHDNQNLAAPVSSGSYKTDGVIVLPCSMKTLAAVSNGFCDSLIARVCDVALKERRKLILCPRETPLNSIHLEQMLRLSNMGASIIPPMPAFYHHPETIEDLICHFIMKITDQFQLEYPYAARWGKEPSQP